MASKGRWWEKFATVWKRKASTPTLEDNDTNLSSLKPRTGDPSDLRLPVELWLAIINYLEGADLKSLSRTARRLRGISVCQLFHTVRVAARSTDMATRIRPLQDAVHILQAVRIVRITGYNKTSTNIDSYNFFAALQSVVRQMSGLEHLKVSCAYIEPSFYEEIFYLPSLKILELSSCILATRVRGPPLRVLQSSLTSISFGWDVGTPGSSILTSSYSTLQYLNLQGLLHPTDQLIISGPLPHLQSFESTGYLAINKLWTFFSMNPTLTTLTLWWRGFPGHVEVNQLVSNMGAERPLLPNLINLTCMGDLAEVLIPRRSIKRLNAWKVEPSVVRRIGETTATTYEKLMLSMSSLGWDAFTVDVLGKESALLVQGVVELTLSITEVTASQVISALATQIDHGALPSLQILSVTANGPLTPPITLNEGDGTFTMVEAWVPCFVMQVESLVQLENAKSLRYLALQVQGPGAFHVTCRSKRLGPVEWLLEAERAGETMETRWTRREKAKDLGTAVSHEV